MREKPALAFQATEPVVWASRASQAAARGCKSRPEVKPLLSLLAMATGVCVSLLCKVGSSSEGQCIFLIAWKGDFQAAKWRDLGEKAGFFTNSRAKKRKGGQGGSGAGVCLSSGCSG